MSAAGKMEDGKPKPRTQTATAGPGRAPSPLRVLAATTAAIFAAEALIMLALSALLPLNPNLEIFVDALVLVVIVFPALLLLVYRPMRQYLSERNRAEDSLRWELALNQAVALLADQLLDPDASIETTSQALLDQAQSLTGSEHGYLSSIDPVSGDIERHALTEMMDTHGLGPEEQAIRFPKGKGADGLYPGLWGHALNGRDGFYTNTPSAHEAAAGTPEGHIPLKNFLTVPAIVGGRLVGQIALANSERDYTERDLQAIERLAVLHALSLQRREAEMAVADSEERYRRLVEYSPDGVLIHCDGEIVFANPTMSEIMGGTSEDLLGKPVMDIVHEDFRALAGERVELIRSQQEALPRVEMKFIRLDGSDVEVDVVSIPFTFEGRFAVQTVVRDISDYKIVEERLRHSQKMEALGTLAGGIAHDFNNILFAILGCNELAMEDVEKDSSVYELLTEIHVSAHRASDLVEQILTVSRKAERERKPVRVQAIAEEALKLVGKTLPATIEVLQSTNADCGPVMTDPTEIHQIFMNLCTNSYHAMLEHGGVLKVQVEQVNVESEQTPNHSELGPGAHVRITVSDTGHGMDAETLERIFEPYFTTKGAGEGTGLGLATVHAVVKACQGAISVESAVGQGTTFEILLPCCPHEVDAADIEEDVDEVAVYNGTERVLVIDDEQPIVDVLSMLLKRRGYDVTAFTNSEAAADAFRADPNAFDLILTDQTMPKLTGAQFSEQALELRPGIPIILCTGHSDLVNRESAARMGVRGYLKKPIIARELTRTVRRLLDETQDQGHQEP